MGEHERLKNPTAAEVLFEIRFGTDRTFDSYIDEIEENFRETYPKRENLNRQGIGIKFGSEGAEVQLLDPNQETDVPRARFKAEGGRDLFQVGPEILTVNTTRYSGFNEFVEKVKWVLEKHSDIAKVSSCKRFSLRYLNHIEWSPPETVFSWIAPLPLTMSDNEFIASNVQEILLRREEDFQKIAAAYPVRSPNDQPIIVLDIDHFKEFSEQTPFNLSYIQQWIQNAHEAVWHTYTQALNPDFYERIKNG